MSRPAPDAAPQGAHGAADLDTDQDAPTGNAVTIAGVVALALFAGVAIGVFLATH